MEEILTLEKLQIWAGIVWQGGKALAQGKSYRTDGSSYLTVLDNFASSYLSASDNLEGEKQGCFQDLVP